MTLFMTMWCNPITSFQIFRRRMDHRISLLPWKARTVLIGSTSRPICRLIQRRIRVSSKRHSSQRVRLLWKIILMSIFSKLRTKRPDHRCHHQQFTNNSVKTIASWIRAVVIREFRIQDQVFNRLGKIILVWMELIRLFRRVKILEVDW